MSCLPPEKGFNADVLSSFLSQIEKGSEENLIAFFQSKRFPINSRAPTTGHRPIHFAVIYKREQLLRYLVENRASLDVQDARGFSPLHYSVHLTYVIGVEILLKGGASREIFPGNTPEILLQRMINNPQHSSQQLEIEQIRFLFSLPKSSPPERQPALLPSLGDEYTPEELLALHLDRDGPASSVKRDELKKLQSAIADAFAKREQIQETSYNVRRLFPDEVALIELALRRANEELYQACVAFKTC